MFNQCVVAIIDCSEESGRNFGLEGIIDALDRLVLLVTCLEEFCVLQENERSLRIFRVAQVASLQNGAVSRL